MTDRRSVTDILIIGGGPVGLAAAIEASLAGMSATVVEPRTGPIDKACGEGLMPGALTALTRLGVDPAGHTISGISYQSPGREAIHRFKDAPGRGVRRTTLHAALAARATGLGINTVTSRVVAVEQNEEAVTVALVDGRTLSAPWLLGCDGLHSTIRELVGLAVPPPGKQKGGRRRYGVRRHYARAPWSDLVEVHWAAHSEVYVTPVSDTEVGVAVLGLQHTDYDDAVASVPALAAMLAGAQAASSTKGAGPLRQFTTARTEGRVLLVGDASGYVDAITGEGIRVGLAQSRAAVAAIAAGDAHRYEQAWKRETRDFRILTSGLVALGASPLRSAIVPLAKGLPGIYGNIVERLAR